LNSVVNKGAKMPRFPEMKKSSEKNYDVAIIGGGITGITQLANKGVDYSKELIYGALKNTLKYRKRQRVS
jgi:hypothetical protein